MFDVWAGEASFTSLVIIISIAIVLPVQLLLCFKAKSVFIRFIPIIVLFLAAVAAVVIFLIIADWEGLIFLFAAVYAAYMALICGVGWLVWAAVNFIKNKGRNGG